MNIKKSLWIWKCFSECNKIFSEYENVSLNKIKFSPNIKAWILHLMSHNIPPYAFQKVILKLNFNLNSSFCTSSCCLKRFYEGLKGLYKTFWGTTKKCKIKKLLSSLRPGSEREGLIIKVVVFGSCFIELCWSSFAS